MSTLTGTPPQRETERWRRVDAELRLLCREGARLYVIRRDAPALLTLRQVEARRKELRRRMPEIFEAGSDGRPEALLAVLRDCVGGLEDPSDTRLLWTVMDLDTKMPDTIARVRRAQAGRSFRGRDGRRLGESSIRQNYEPPARKRLADRLLTLEDELGGPS